ncbi:hypothetical protein Nepgr_010239 [Nepenthes gracilis]|uniref:Sec16 Sec23-binding domain-containing protein n=1 Tax=Nepenthes gracilis TaxID=150966 RepID=A0AAD3XL46_NEPGR|nr:hypothetical protein Nepgr_010239 [Nepenthes gracilis]
MSGTWIQRPHSDVIQGLLPLLVICHTAKHEGDEGIREDSYEADSSEEAVSVIVARERDLEEQTKEYVNDYAFAGPRTLILTYLELNQAEYTEFTQNFSKARNSLSVDREPTIDQVAEKIENDLILLGTTADEDTLRNGVSQRIDRLAHAIIKMRVLTGDQMETTINVGFACNLLRQGMKQVPINLDSPDLKTLAKIGNKDVISKYLQGRVPHQIMQGTDQLVSSARSEATALTSYEKSSQSYIFSRWATVPRTTCRKTIYRIAYQHFGKLQSLGTDTSLRANELPDSVVVNLFAPTRGKSPLPTDRKKEAVQLAEEGQLWGFALILAHELGEQFYINAVKKVVTSHLGAGLPLRTLCLLIAKKLEDVFSTNIMRGVGLPEPVHISPPTVQQFAGYNRMDNWEGNLAIITANRTKNNHVIAHPGDSLWKDGDDFVATYICYLVVEADSPSFYLEVKNVGTQGACKLKPKRLEMVVPKFEIREVWSSGCSAKTRPSQGAGCHILLSLPGATNFIFS